MAIETSIDSDLGQVPYEQLPQIIYQLEQNQQLAEDQGGQQPAIMAQSMAGEPFALKAAPTHDLNLGALGSHPAFGIR